LAGGLIGVHLVSGTPTVALDRDIRHSVPSVRHYSDEDIVNVIVGEASNQGYEGMLAVAGALRNRMKDSYYKNDILRGVFGKSAKHIKSEPEKIFDTARMAWEDSKNQDLTNGATIWGNDSDVELFKQQDWFKNVVQTVKIENHTFFRKK